MGVSSLCGCILRTSLSLSAIALIPICVVSTHNDSKKRFPEAFPNFKNVSVNDSVATTFTQILKVACEVFSSQIRLDPLSGQVPHNDCISMIVFVICCNQTPKIYARGTVPSSRLLHGAFFFLKNEGMVSAQQNHTCNARTNAAAVRTDCPAPPAPHTSSKESAKARAAAHKRMFDNGGTKQPRRWHAKCWERPEPSQLPEPARNALSRATNARQPRRQG